MKRYTMRMIALLLALVMGLTLLSGCVPSGPNFKRVSKMAWLMPLSAVPPAVTS